MKWSRKTRGAAVLAVVLIALFLFRPGVYRLRDRIASSIGNALGRQVSIDSVHLHILPRPGFDLEGLTIYDDPAFSAEPMMRAGYVSAAIRVRSLMRGRLEIGSLSANYPSINLVRNEQGRWNFSALLERNAQIPAAPTDKPAFQRQPIFPYLEAAHARVNFKTGAIKKSYALMDADLSFWQDSENSWSARLKAVPVRTDFNLTDTGTVIVEGKWQRASSLRATPLQFSAKWQNGQLGQITKLLSGNDRGWRGDVALSATVSGSLNALALQSNLRIDAFHRYDIAVRDNVRLAVNCASQYDAIAATASNLVCVSPVGTGKVSLAGNLGPVFELVRNPIYDLTFSVEDVPISSMLRLLRQSKKYVPAELKAGGSLKGTFRAARFTNGTHHGSSTRASQICGGSGTASEVHLTSPKPRQANSDAESNELVFNAVPVELSGCNGSAGARAKARSTSPSLRVGPAILSVNSTSPITLGGSVSGDGYQFFLRGDSTLRDLFSLEDVMGIPGARPAADGLAKLDVGVSGGWRSFSAPVPSGGAQLRNVHAKLRWMNAPVIISSAIVLVDPAAITFQKVIARVGTTNWTGQVLAPRHCAASSEGLSSVTLKSAGMPVCQFRFNLSADSFSVDDLRQWFSPRPSKRPWYRVLDASPDDASAGAGPSPLLPIQAEGSLQVGRFLIGPIIASQWSSNVEVDRGKISLVGLKGEFLQGTHHGNWVIDLNHSPSAADPTTLRGSGSFTNILLDGLNEAFGQHWMTGSASGTYAFTGTDLRDSLHNSEAKLKFVVRNGSLPQIELPDSSEPLRVLHFAGELKLSAGQWRLSDARLESQPNTFNVTGTASSASDVDFTLTGSDEKSWSITGSLADPHIAQTESSTEVKRTEAVIKAVSPQIRP